MLMIIEQRRRALVRRGFVEGGLGVGGGGDSGVGDDGLDDIFGGVWERCGSKYTFYEADIV